MKILLYILAGICALPVLMFITYHSLFLWSLVNGGKETIQNYRPDDQQAYPQTPSDTYWISTPHGMMGIKWDSTFNFWNTYKPPYRLSLRTDYNVAMSYKYDQEALKDAPLPYKSVTIQQIEVISSKGNTYHVAPEFSYPAGKQRQYWQKDYQLPITLDAENPAMVFQPALKFDFNGGEFITLRLHLLYTLNDGKNAPFVLETKWRPESFIWHFPVV